MVPESRSGAPLTSVSNEPCHEPSPARCHSSAWIVVLAGLITFLANPGTLASTTWEVRIRKDESSPADSRTWTSRCCMLSYMATVASLSRSMAITASIGAS